MITLKLIMQINNNFLKMFIFPLKNDNYLQKKIK